MNISHQYAELPTNTHRLKAFLTREALVTAVHALVVSCIDYCNALSYDISDYDINQLQWIQNHLTSNSVKTYIIYLLDSVFFQDFTNNR